MVSFSLLSAKPGHRPLSMPGHQDLAFASPNLQASTLSSPPHPLGTRDLLAPAKVSMVIPLPRGQPTPPAALPGLATVTPLGPQTNLSQGDDSTYSWVRDEDSFTVSSAATSKAPRVSRRRQGWDHSGKSPGGPLAVGLQGPLGRTLNRKTKSRP